MKHGLWTVGLLLLFVEPSLAWEYAGGSLQVRAQQSLQSLQPFHSNVVTAGYSNVTNFTGSVILHGGAALAAGDRITRLIADDITPLASTAGLDVTSFTFSVVNVNPDPVRFRPLIRFWNADGVGGGPGSYYTAPVAVGFSFNPITVSGFTVALVTASPAPGQFTMPSGKFWAGVTFDDQFGATGATSAQLDQLGQAMFEPVTVGSSQGTHFMTSVAGSFFPTPDPAGAFGSSGGSPNASFGWEFKVDVPVPTQRSTWGRIKTLYR